MSRLIDTFETFDNVDFHLYDMTMTELVSHVACRRLALAGFISLYSHLASLGTIQK